MTGLRLVAVGRDATTVAGLAAIDCGRWIAHVDPAAGPPDMAGIKRHHRQVLAVLSQGPALPAPFGPLFAGPGDMITAVGAVLDRPGPDPRRYADGYEEWSLRCRPTAPGAAAEGLDGRAYLRAERDRRRAMATAHAGMDAVAAGLGAVPSIEAATAAAGRSDEIRFSLLVAHANRDRAVTIAADEIARALPGWEIRAHGPWPIYSFSGLARLAPPVPPAEVAAPAGVLEIPGA